MSQQFSAADIADLLAKTIGDEKALMLVEQATAALGFSKETIGRAEALAVLERISEEPGIVGISARFAKSRVHLLQGESPAL